MARIGGGRFWMGSERGKFASDEEPRFQTDVPSYCLDTTEVTVSAYQLCVKSGRCQAAHSGQFSCNTRDGEAKPGRDNHPINCVDYTQAAAFCAVKGARLPTEAEWEYAARGGDKLLTYPWGEGSPDGRACWKHAGTCSVRSFPAFEFGIYDLSGNVWEWVQDWYGPYPWPALYGFSRVYRGGSFSRRFEKWMHTRLRNREKPEYWGSHLGFRCAASVPGAPCPAGKDSTTGTCLATVSAVECPPGKEWNGARCARPGDAKCRPGFSEKAGHGCVLPEQAEVPPTDLSSAGISRTRTPNFDADCATYKKGLPLAFQYVGGTHAARNLVSHRAGCKNRDVGNGWNSVCCPSP
ncbi:MAG: SUMF1/EgtB/PvdO family nonheme iron enzyme [Polyangiaceae bacterium]|nr:SUMF1/EgtB/PvdO family nonheme iron enzyme [Polyangiaceae bacterium]